MPSVEQLQHHSLLDPVVSELVGVEVVPTAEIGPNRGQSSCERDVMIEVVESLVDSNLNRNA